MITSQNVWRYVIAAAALILFALWAGEASNSQEHEYRPPIVRVGDEP